MPAILKLAHTHGIAVIEACAQAYGARIHPQSVGSFCDVAAWSVCQDKILTNRRRRRHVFHQSCRSLGCHVGLQRPRQNP
jgi:hypothetical protein